jgi:hypothetical protein
VEALQATGPRFHGTHVEELRHGTRGRSEIARGDASLLVEVVAVEHVRLQAEDVVVRTRLEVAAEPRQGSRVVELVAVDAQRPGMRPRVLLDRAVRISGVARAIHRDVVVLLGEPAQDPGRPVGREVVDHVDAVADVRDVADRPLEEDVLVPDQDDPHEPQLQASVVVQSSRGRTTPRH